jgi:hypothetical protein
MKEYINKSFAEVTQILLKCKSENFKVFYENDLNESFEICGYMTEGEHAFVQIKDIKDFVIIKPTEKIYIIRN